MKWYLYNLPINKLIMSTKIKSPANTLNKEDIKNILRQIAIFFTPVWILLLDQIEAWQIDFTILYGFAISIVLEAVRRYLREVK